LALLKLGAENLEHALFKLLPENLEQPPPSPVGRAIGAIRDPNSSSIPVPACARHALIRVAHPLIRLIV